MLLLTWMWATVVLGMLILSWLIRAHRLPVRIAVLVLFLVYAVGVCRVFQILAQTWGTRS